ncbi:MAG: FecR domain-containing protein [Planctomycetota bacterium]|jgi:ferric-dicitrate binding protein FerR (iron transport regulator)
MNCQEAQVLSIPHIMGDLDPSSKQYQELEAHLAICQVCAEEYESSKETVEFIQEHKAEFAEAFEAIDREKAAEQEEIERCWKRMEAELDKLEAQKKQEKQAKFRRLFVRVSAAAACLAIGVFTWMTFSIHSTPETTQKLVPQQVILAPKLSVKIELISENGSILIPANRQIVSSNNESKTLVINNKHRMTMNSNTSLSVESLEKNGIGCLVKLDFGQIYANVEHDGNPFVVDTAHGKAVITGTTFDIKATDTGTTLVVGEGAVQFGSDGGFVNVAAGQTSRIIAKLAPTRPILCNAAKLTAWATGYKASPVLAQVAPTKSYSNTSTSNFSWSTDEEPIVLEENVDGIKTAAELIEQAHKHDTAYTLGDSANRQKALSLYNSALEYEPDEKQRLHILHRMAQLYGTAYRKDKGEKPNYRRAMELYKEIIDSYPPDEPKVIEAMLWTGGHHTTLREVESAIKSFKKALDIDTDEMKERMESLQENGQEEEAASLQKNLDSIKHYQEIGVDHIDYAANRIGYLYAHGELRAIVDKHHGTFIGDRAHDRLVENMNKMPSLWAPTNDEPFSQPESTLQAAFPAPAAHTESQKHKGIKTQTDTIPEATKKHYTVEPNITEIPQKDKHIAREPRAPPLSYLSKCLIGAASLIILILAAVIIKKQKTNI